MIKIYTSKNCPQCTMTKMLLARFDLPFEELNAEENVEYLHSKNIRSLPFVEVDFKCYHNSWTGFKPNLIKELNENVRISKKVV